MKLEIEPYRIFLDKFKNLLLECIMEKKRQDKKWKLM